MRFIETRGEACVIRRKPECWPGKPKRPAAFANHQHNRPPRFVFGRVK